MESDAKRGVGSDENDGEELSPMLTITSLNRGMDSIVAKAGTLSATLENIKGISISFERKFKRDSGSGSDAGSFGSGNVADGRRSRVLHDKGLDAA